MRKPIEPKNQPPRNCKIIATCFAGREVRLATASCGSPPGLFEHAQVFPDADSVLELVTLIASIEQRVDPGRDCDTIIVNNDVGWRKGNRYLDSIHGSRTFAGTFRVVHRANFGTSLGAYNHAYELFRDQYDYWTFTEDDVLINGNGWLARCIETFEASERIGFAAIQGLSAHWALHAHGGIGTTHVKVLDAVKAAWGALPHRNQIESQGDEEHAVFGEVLFTNIIDRLGFRLVTVESDSPLYEFAYDHMMRAQGRPSLTYQPGLVPRLLRKIARTTEAWAQQIEKRP